MRISLERLTSQLPIVEDIKCGVSWAVIVVVGMEIGIGIGIGIGTDFVFT